MIKQNNLQYLTKKMSMIILGLFCFASFSYADFRSVDSNKVEESISKGIVIIDIRRMDEWVDTGVIPTSNKLTFFNASGDYDINSWMSQFKKIVKDKNQPFILVCRSSHRTGKVGNLLDKEMGYKNVYHLKGGIGAWMSENKKTIPHKK